LALKPENTFSSPKLYRPKGFTAKCSKLSLKLKYIHSLVVVYKLNFDKFNLLKYLELFQYVLTLLYVVFLYKNVLFFQLSVVFIFLEGIFNKKGINNLIFLFKPLDTQRS